MGSIDTDKTFVNRHSLVTRIWHWTNAVALVVLLTSGLAIFNAHPRLYWGETGFLVEDAWFQIDNVASRAFMRVGDNLYETTGTLGDWADESGDLQARAFPAWMTLPASSNLAEARGWHLTLAWLFAANLVVFVIWALLSGHLYRDLCPSPRELRPRGVLRTMVGHLTLRFDHGPAAGCYNVFQKLSYLAIIVGILPAMILSGLAMSPTMVAAWPWLLDIFSGRQSARSVHFIAAALIVVFVAIHLLMVLLAGPWNHVRAMVTGRLRRGNRS